MLSNYPDGMTGREFDTDDFDVVCPKCGEEWTEEVSSTHGAPSEFECECESCGHSFTHECEVNDDYDDYRDRDDEERWDRYWERQYER